MESSKVFDTWNTFPAIAIGFFFVILILFTLDPNFILSNLLNNSNNNISIVNELILITSFIVISYAAGEFFLSAGESLLDKIFKANENENENIIKAILEKNEHSKIEKISLSSESYLTLGVFLALKENDYFLLQSDNYYRSSIRLAGIFMALFFWSFILVIVFFYYLFNFIRTDNTQILSTFFYWSLTYFFFIICISCFIKLKVKKLQMDTFLTLLSMFYCVFIFFIGIFIFTYDYKITNKVLYIGLLILSLLTFLTFLAAKDKREKANLLLLLSYSRQHQSLITTYLFPFETPKSNSKSIHYSPNNPFKTGR